MKDQPDFQTFIEPEMEARVVAWVLGEASAFEVAEMERLAGERPELAIFKRRIAAVHGLVGQAARPEGEALRLSPERRRKVLETIGGVPAGGVVAVPGKRAGRQELRRFLPLAAACVVIGLVAAGLMMPVYDSTVQKRASRSPAVAMEMELPAVQEAKPAFASQRPVASATPQSATRAMPLDARAAQNAAPRKAEKTKRSQDVSTFSRERRLAELEGPGLADELSRGATLASAGSGVPMNREGGASDGFYANTSPEDRETSGEAQDFGGEYRDKAGERAQLQSKLSADLDRSGISELVSREELVRKADVAWASPVRNYRTWKEPGKESNSAIVDKLDAIVVPRVQLKDVTLSEALDSLEKQSAEHDAEPDPARRGVKITSETTVENEPRVTLDLKNVRLGEALHYVTRLAGMKQNVGPDGVSVVPQSEPTDVLVTKEYRVPPSFFPTEGTSVAREYLEQQGVMLPPGASATWHSESNRLIMRNTQENLDLVDTLVSAAVAASEPVDEEIAAAEEPFSTFSLHVSDVSFELARAALAKGERPDPATIRPEEFYNAFDYGDPAPAAGEPVACRIEQAAHPVLQQRNLVRIAAKVPASGRGAGQSLRLTVLLDTSGSMEREDRAASVGRALEALGSLLGPDDAVTLVGFARRPRLLAEQVSGDRASRLAEIARSTPSEGGTNLEEALALAAEMALKHRDPAAQNRIVLLTDGATNLGNANPVRLAASIERLRQQGIAFDACGVGADGLNDEILEALTRKGDGRYYFLNKPEDADAGFARKLAGAFRPAAENVKVQVRFNPARVGNYRLIGFEKHRLETEDFRNDAVDASELAAEEAAVALYQVEVLPEGEGELGEVSMRFRTAGSGDMVERSWTMGYEPQAPAFDRAAPSMQLAGTAALLAEKLRGGAESLELDVLAPVVARLRGHYAQQQRVQELVAMFEQMRSGR